MGASRARGEHRTGAQPSGRGQAHSERMVVGIVTGPEHPVAQIRYRLFGRRKAVSRFNGEGYDEDYNNQWELWEANTLRHMRGAAGQAVLRELREALLALPERKLI